MAACRQQRLHRPVATTPDDCRRMDCASIIMTEK